MTDRRRSSVPARPALEALPLYRPGRSPAQALADYGVSGAVKLASNELAFGLLPSVEKALADDLGRANRYPDHGAVALRERLADRFGVPVACIGVGAGAVGLLGQLALAYVGPGDAVVFGDPSFEAYPIFTKLAGGAPRPVPLTRQTIDADRFLAASSEATRLVLLAQPNNPTSTAMAGDDLRRLADELPPTCLLVVDEAYHEFARGRHLVAGTALLDTHPNVVVLRTFSKAYGLAALRVGFAVANPDVVEAMDKCLLPFSVNSLAQAAAIAALDESAEVERRVDFVLAERERARAELSHLGFGVPASEANFLWLPAGGTASELAVALERRGVVTRPFLGAGVRVTIGAPSEVDRFLGAFGEVAASELGGRLEVAWALPAGPGQKVVETWLERLHTVEDQLVALEQGGSRAGLTEPDPGGDERWEDTQVWAHLSEFPDYWVNQLQIVLNRAGSGPVPFGRTKADRARRGAIAGAGREDVGSYVHRMLVACDRLRAVLCGMDGTDWAARGTHPTLGAMDVPTILDEFLVGHLEEHTAQLEALHA